LKLVLGISVMLALCATMAQAAQRPAPGMARSPAVTPPAASIPAGGGTRHAAGGAEHAAPLVESGSMMLASMGLIAIGTAFQRRRH
jgi:hypothetical protein